MRVSRSELMGKLSIGAAGVRGPDGRAAGGSRPGCATRFDATAFDAPGGRARLRLAVDDAGAWDFVVNGRACALEPAERAAAPRRTAVRRPRDVVADRRATCAAA